MATKRRPATGGVGSNQYQTRGTPTASVAAAVRVRAGRFAAPSGPNGTVNPTARTTATRVERSLRHLAAGTDETGAHADTVAAAAPVLAASLHRHIDESRGRLPANFMQAQRDDATRLAELRAERGYLSEDGQDDLEVAVADLARALLDPGLDPTTMRPLGASTVRALIGESVVDEVTGGRAIGGGAHVADVFDPNSPLVARDVTLPLGGTREVSVGLCDDGTYRVRRIHEDRDRGRGRTVVTVEVEQRGVVAGDLAYAVRDVAARRAVNAGD